MSLYSDKPLVLPSGPASSSKVMDRLDGYSERLNAKFNDIDKFCLETEKKLNVVGYIPFVGSWSAIVRKVLGIAQIVGGLVVGIFAVIARIYHRNNEEKAKLYDALIDRSFNYVGQGFLNCGRAILEGFFLGPVTTMPFDLTGRKILRYPTEEADYKRNLECIEVLGVRARAYMNMK